MNIQAAYPTGSIAWRRKHLIERAEARNDDALQWGQKHWLSVRKNLRPSLGSTANSQRIYLTSLDCSCRSCR